VGVSVTNPADEYEALVHVVERVAFRFPWADETELYEIVAEELARFGPVRVREYIPVLVEGRVVRRLRAESSGERLAS
jgi:hypothetical protein